MQCKLLRFFSFSELGLRNKNQPKEEALGRTSLRTSSQKDSVRPSKSWITSILAQTSRADVHKKTSVWKTSVWKTSGWFFVPYSYQENQIDPWPRYFSSFEKFQKQMHLDLWHFLSDWQGLCSVCPWIMQSNKHGCHENRGAKTDPQE